MPSQDAQQPIPEGANESPPTVKNEETPQDVDQQIREVSDQLLHLLEQEPKAKEIIESIIQEHVRNDVDTETGGALYDGLAIYAGEDTANFLLMLLAGGMSDPELLAEVEAYLSPEVRKWVRTLMGLYGNAIVESYTIGGENPNSWRTVNRQVYYDLMSERWIITFEVLKYNGERTVYEEAPSSLLFLADAILDTLNRLPAEVAPDILDPGRLESFINTCSVFLHLFAPDLTADGEEESGNTSPSS
ncbi:MAG TPA: hypothetical protein G4O02_11750 [Caldilineae bacterium]|nr:hypothetical protein [Caldilineae bacterium]